MPNDPSRPPKPTWRQQGNPQQQRRPEAQKAWRKETVADKPGKVRWSRKKKFGLAFLSLLVCAGLLIGLVLMLHKPKGACLVLIGDGYEKNLAIPHNVYDMQALSDLAAIAKPTSLADSFSWSESGDLRLQYGPQVLGPEDPWTKGWDHFSQQTVVIFLALHGGANSEEPYLLRDTSAGPKQRLKLSTILADLAKHKDKSIVLILDPTQIAADASLGMLHNDFSRQLKNMEKEIAKVPNLVILQASDEGQRSWVSEEWQQSIFAHYVVEGLKGGACAGGTGQITAQDLHDYVHNEVKKWVLLNRDAAQEPILIDPNKRASAIELAVVKEKYTPPDPAVVEQARGHHFSTPSDLTAVWNDYQEMANRPLRPFVHSPHLWRQYGETLLRYEQLLRAGDPTGKAPAVRSSLDTLLTRMRGAERDLQTKLPSMMYALPLPQTLGLASPWKENDLRERFDDLWTTDKPGDQFNKAREWAGNEGSSARLLRMQFDRLLLNKVIDSPGEDHLKKAYALAKLYHDGDNPRPAEINFLAVLANESEKTRPETAETIRQALALRRQAEEVALAAQTGEEKTKAFHPYSEWTYSWIKNDVEQGDAARRLGEDLLFSSQESDWSDAKTFFVQAKQAYDRASEDSAAIRAALTIRDQALAELPAYARWLGRKDNADDKAIDELDSLWTAVHALADTLDPAPIPPRGPPDRGTLKTQTDLIKSGLDAQRRKFQQILANAVQHSEQQQQYWREAEELLSVPLLPDENGVIAEGSVRTRMRLLENSRSISDALNIKASQAGTTLRAPPVTTPPLKLAQKQGRLALASLGLSVVDRLARESQTPTSDFKEMARAVRNAGGAWQGDLDRTGEEIGNCFAQLLPTAIQDEVTKGREKVENAQTSLHQADRLARELDPAGAAQLKGNPPDEYRRLRLQGLLLWMADRTLHDHWWSEGEVPYYRDACNAFLADARAVAFDRSDPSFSEKQKDLRADPPKAQELREQLSAPQELIVKGLLEDYWFTDKALDLAYALEVPKELKPGLPGFPVRRLILNKRLMLADGKPDGRRVIRQADGKTPLGITDGKPMSVELKYPVRLAEGASGAPEAKLEVFYRGRKIPTPTPVHIQSVADTVYHEYPVPRTSDVAVRVDANAYPISLKIVLDGTNSMGSSAAWNAKTPCKYHRATTALRSILKEMPDKTRVSILGFGFTHKDSSELEQLERPFIRDYRDAGQMDDVMDRLELKQPQGEQSPIVARLVDVKKHFEDQEGPGYKAILLLTDGEDNVLKDSKRAGELILDAYGSRNIKVDVVLFQPVADEIENAKAQFKAVEKLTPRGTLREANTVDDLTAALIDTMLPKVRFRLPQDGTLVQGKPEQGKNGFPTTFVRSPDLKWFQVAQPREYEAVLPDSETRRFSLKFGERLLVTLTAKEKNVLFERTLYYEYEKRDRKRSLPDAVEAGDWQLGVLQNQLKTRFQSGDPPHLQMMVAIEGLTNRTVDRDHSLQLFRPNFIWQEIWNQADDPRDAGPMRMDWGNLSGFPAAAWTVEAPDWDDVAKKKPASKPQLRTWVLSDREVPSAALLRRDPKDGFLQKFQVDREDVIVESVDYATRDVQIKPDAKPVKKDCVVVHLRHAPKKTVMLQMRGLSALGSEHYFFDKANKYTAVFWGIEKDQFNDPSLSFDLISVDEVKRIAKPAKADLDAPQPGDERPIPP